MTLLYNTKIEFILEMYIFDDDLKDWKQNTVGYFQMISVRMNKSSSNKWKEKTENKKKMLQKKLLFFVYSYILQKWFCFNIKWTIKPFQYTNENQYQFNIKCVRQHNKYFIGFQTATYKLQIRFSGSLIWFYIFVSSLTKSLAR